jgi:hypothetical protein
MNSFPAEEETYVEQGKDGKAKTQSTNTPGMAYTVDKKHFFIYLTKIYTVAKIHSFLMLRHVVHIVTTVLQMIQWLNNCATYQ